jgi:hypothetical protein
MGLDIFAHRVKSNLVEENDFNVRSNPRVVLNAVNEDEKAFFVKKTKGMVSYMRSIYNKQTTEEYKESYIKFIKRLRKTFPIYDEYTFKLTEFGWDDRNNKLVSVKSPGELERIFEESLKFWYAFEDAYFRKVNFIYRYFSQFDNFTDECCIVTKSAISYLLEKCNDVYAHKGDEDYAIENLPTQSGFFFGSTDYDDWYWKDLENCIKQMKALYKKMADDELVLWVFSW